MSKGDGWGVVAARPFVHVQVAVIYHHTRTKIVSPWRWRDAESHGLQRRHGAGGEPRGGVLGNFELLAVHIFLFRVLFTFSVYDLTAVQLYSHRVVKGRYICMRCMYAPCPHRPPYVLSRGFLVSSRIEPSGARAHVPSLHFQI